MSKYLIVRLKTTPDSEIARSLDLLAEDFRIAPLDWHRVGDIMQLNDDTTVLIGGEPRPDEISFICIAIGTFNEAKVIVLQDTISQSVTEEVARLKNASLSTLAEIRQRMAG